MEDFLNEINEKSIQGTCQCHLERIQKLKIVIQKEKELIYEKIQRSKNNLKNFLKKNQRRKSLQTKSLNIEEIKINFQGAKSADFRQSPNHIDLNTFQGFLDCNDVEDCFLMFERACNSTLNTFFLLLMEDEFLTLQSQQEILNKINFIKKSVEKSLFITIKQIQKISSSKYQSIPQNEVQNPQESQEVSLQIREFEQERSSDLQNKNKQKGRKKMIKKKGKNGKIPYKLTLCLQRWLLQNFDDPYPSFEQKEKISRESGLTIYQVNNWFINSRERVIKKLMRKGSNLQQTNSESFSQQQQQTYQKGQSLKKMSNKIQRFNKKSQK